MVDEGFPPAEFAAMEAVSPFRLAQWWGTRALRPVGTDTDADVEAEVSELAVMCALGQWLRRWVPGWIHRALRDGASLDQVVAATGLSAAGVRVEWTQWAVSQRQLYDDTRTSPHGPFGISDAEYNQVRAALQSSAHPDHGDERRR